MNPPPGEGWSNWPAPAKLNLFLRITGRRPDGYHELQTVMQLLDWGDSVHLRVLREAAIIRVGGGTADIPEADDLSVKAAKFLQKATNCPKGVEISITKRIPQGGGFGGGSSDAATVLQVLNRLWDTRLDTESLAEIGLQLGADVPVFVRGLTAWAEGVGEILQPIDLPPAWFVLVDPGIHVPTRDLFQAPELTRDAPPATMLDFVSGASLGNAFEPVLRRLEPAVDATLRFMSELGQACLTGSGSGCFLRFETREAALQARAALPGEWHSWVVAGVTRSPLLAALDASATPD